MRFLSPGIGRIHDFVRLLPSRFLYCIFFGGEGFPKTSFSRKKISFAWVVVTLSLFGTLFIRCSRLVILVILLPPLTTTPIDPCSIFSKRTALLRGRTAFGPTASYTTFSAVCLLAPTQERGQRDRQTDRHHHSLDSDPACTIYPTIMKASVVASVAACLSVVAAWPGWMPERDAIIVARQTDDSSTLFPSC